jgi:hypothetical protein
MELDIFKVTGFASNTGQKVRQAIMGLATAMRQSKVATNGERSSLSRTHFGSPRGNPGGPLLTSVVADVAFLFGAKEKVTFVSRKGRGFPGVAL